MEVYSLQRLHEPHAHYGEYKLHPVAVTSAMSLIAYPIVVVRILKNKAR